MSNEFVELNLNPQLAQTVMELGYTNPTPIQTAIIPIMLDGQDVIGQAQTGTGKTAAFALPILHNLTIDQKSVQCLVIAPTRELAIQVAHSMHEYGRHLEVRVLPIYGGQPYHRQIGRLKRGVDIVVGTPGRLLDLLEQKALDLRQVSTVVLDEADEMLSMGFIEDIEAILKETPSSRQTALFSATMPGPIRRLADQYMREPESITVGPKQATVETIEQRFYVINETDKLAALTRLFEVEPISSVLIFARTRQGTGELANELTVRGFSAEALHGDMSQDARIQVLNRFRKNQINVLVATDVAARGLDIEDISHVINFDLPLDPEVYVHRIGRTGRAGKTGQAVTLMTPKERWRLGRIEGFTKQRLTQGTLPTEAEIQAHRESELVKKVKVWLNRDRCRREREIVAELVEQGYDPVDIGSVALKLARADEKQRPIVPISEIEVSPRNARSARKSLSVQKGRSFRHDSSPQKFKRGQKQDQYRNGRDRNRRNQTSKKGMICLSLDIGRGDGIEIKHVVGTLAYYANIPGHVLGKIRMQDRQTFVDVPEQFVEQVLAQSGVYRVGKQVIQVALNK